MEREEGELTDEDLEDVSDNSSLSMVSIPIILSGKSPLSASREPFRELSLTSISDDSDDREIRYKVIATRRDNHDFYRKQRCRREERKDSGTKRVRKLSERRIVRRRTSSLHKRYSSVSSSSDETDSYRQDDVILRQLRDAVRINRSQKLPNCSLRTRLKRMIEPDSQGSKNSNSEDDNDLDTLRDLALQSKSKKEGDGETSITDKDLIELRLIALQSAVLKKHQNRRKNKELQMKKTQLETNAKNIDNQNIEIDSAITKTDIENTESKQEKRQNATDNVTDKINESTKTNDDDEAILRAMLLSSISNHNNKNTAENIAKTTEKSDDNEDEALLRAMLLTNICNNNTDAPQSNQENIDKNTRTNSEKVDNTKNSIEEDEDILRAMLLANISKKIASEKSAKQTKNVFSKTNTNLKKINGIIPKTVTNPSDTRNINKVSSVPVNRFIINLNSDSDSDCDQKIENKKSDNASKQTSKVLFDKSLSLFLQQARAKSDASGISHLPKSQQLEYKLLKRKLQLLTRRKLKISAKTKKISTTDENNKLINVRKDKNISNQQVKPALRTMTNDKQINSKDDRLQVKGKYEDLGPLMTKVSDARIARDKAQGDVQRLINDLRIARAELTSTHQNYTALMQQLVKEKSVIDKRLDQTLENKKQTNIPPICTSTPTKVALQENTKEISCDLSAISESETIPAEKLEEDKVPDEEDNTVVQGVEDMEIEETPEEEKKECSILKYSSPLDHIQLNREQPDSNPLSILCPYDLLGVCRDPDCSFRHCRNAITD